MPNKKPPQILSIRARLIKLQVYIAFAILSVAAMGFILNEVLLIKKGFERNITSTGRLLSHNLESSMSFSDTQEALRVLESLKPEPGYEVAYIFDSSGKIFAQYGKAFSPQSYPWTEELKKTPDPKIIRSDMLRIDYYCPIIRGQDFLGVLYLRMNTRTIAKDYTESVGSWILVFLLGLILAPIIARILQGTISAPIVELAELAKKIATTGDFALRAKTNEAQSFAEALTLASEFNRMLDELQLRTQERARLLASEQAAREASNLKSEFLAIVSHEIRTPLNGVIGMSTLLNDTPLGPEQKDYNEMILRSANSLLTVINDILDFSKIESGKLDFESIQFDILDLFKDLQQTFSFAAKKNGITLQFKLDPAIKNLVFGDASRIRQIAVNLIGNAIKFTEKGSVTVSLIKEDPETLICEIQDTGIGMTEQTIQKLFIPFTQADASTTRRFGGTGLGLSISKRLLELMGGELGVSSRLGEGSKFWFRLPLKLGKPISADEEENRVNQYATLDPKLTKGVRVLIAEDNAINQLIAKRTLEKMGIEADTAKTGFEVLELLKKKKYDLILMDCHMPEMDGYTTSERIRASTEGFNSVIIIAMTANAMKGDAERCIASGMNDYLNKPIPPGRLAEMLNRWLSTLPEKKNLA